MAHISRMAAEVNKLIGGSLLTRNAVYLPTIGSLYIITDQDGRKRVEFSSAEQNPSLLAVIKDKAGCTTEQAGLIYERWKSEVRTANALLIDGVGELRDKSFITLDSFSTLLNQTAEKDEEPVVVPPAPVVVPTPTPVAEPTKKEEDKITPPPTPVVVEEKSKPVSQTQKTVKPMAATSQQDKEKKSGSRIIFILIFLAIILGVGYYAYSCVAKSNAEKAAIEAAVKEKQAEQQRIADSIAVAEIEAQRVADQQVIEEAQKSAHGKFRVVYGIFELRSNVDTAIKDINAQFGEGRAKEYPFGPNTLVSMFESDSRAECQKFLMKYYDTFPDTWIYEAKR